MSTVCARLTRFEQIFGCYAPLRRATWADAAVAAVYDLAVAGTLVDVRCA